MFVSKLPPKPDFDVLAAAAPASADRRTFVLALIGNLICSWSNNESLFIYVLMILLRTDEALRRRRVRDIEHDFAPGSI